MSYPNRFYAVTVDWLVVSTVTGMAAAEFTANMGNSLWDYIDLHRAKSPVFHNFYYINEETQDMVWLGVCFEITNPVRITAKVN